MPERIDEQRIDERIAADAMREIYANVTGARGAWHEHDMRYVLQRILQAISEAKDGPPSNRP